MLICNVEDCAFFYYGLLDCIEKEGNEETNLILQNIENIYNFTDISGSTLMHHAATFGNVSLLQNLIDKGYNVHVLNNKGLNPIMLAVENRHVPAIEILLKNNVDLFFTDDSGVSSLERAMNNCFNVPENSNRIIKILFDKINKDSLVDKGRMAQSLLDANDLVKFATVVYGNLSLASFLLKNGYMVNYREPRTQVSALEYTLCFSKIEHAKMLIEHGASLDGKTECSFKPLQCYLFGCQAIDEGSVFLKYLLSQALSNVSLSDRTRREDVGYLLTSGKKKTVRTILQFGIDIYERLATGATLLRVLIENKNVDVLDVFEEFGIKLDACEFASDRTSALTEAAFSGSLRKVEFLLKNKIFDNAITPGVLHAALMNAHTKTLEQGREVAKIAEILLRRGVDTEYVICDRQSIIDEVSYTKYAPSTKMVLSHLAMLAVIKESSLTDFTRRKIANCSVLEACFNLYTQQLERMKELKIYGTVTLFKLLTEPVANILAYARNQELILAFKSSIKNICIESYYLNTLNDRLSYAINRIELEEKAATTFKALAGLCTDAYYMVVHTIFKYLNLEDLCNLHEASIQSQ